MHAITLTMIPAHPATEPAVVAAANAERAAAEEAAATEATEQAEMKAAEDDAADTPERLLPPDAFTIELGAAVLDTKALLEPPPTAGRDALASSGSIAIALDATNWARATGTEKAVREAAPATDDNAAPVREPATFDITATLN